MIVLGGIVLGILLALFRITVWAEWKSNRQIRAREKTWRQQK